MNRSFKILISEFEYLEVTVNGSFTTIKQVSEVNGIREITLPTLAVKDISKEIDSILAIQNGVCKEDDF